MSTKPGASGRRPPLLVAVAVLVGLEALLLVAAAAYEARGLLTGAQAVDPVAAGVLAAMALLFAAALAFCARGLLQGAAWARSPVLVWQLLQLAAGLPAFSGGSAWLGVVIGLPPVLVLVGLFLRPVAAATSR
ncbi:hypothetical protein GTR02_13350 [Kineococcus sp. R8]|uniref:hypothetical protein n=1 Tax=Kineococcus siccus TaxID=2696567 RepID=UPI001413063E|nr:hypothetical protein [Kineococcus siccus]NAZ82804.1 hypothetical protein [Kineococcus siccus]